MVFGKEKYWKTNPAVIVGTWQARNASDSKPTKVRVGNLRRDIMVMINYDDGDGDGDVLSQISFDV